MPIAIRSGGSLTGSSTNGNDIVISLPAGTATGDVIYVMATTNGIPAMGTSGYTQVATVSFNANAETARVFRKVMGATPDTQAVITGTGSQQDSMSVVLYVLTGVDTTSPEDATSPTGTTGSSVNPDSPAITTVTRTAWVLSYAATDVVNTISSYPSTYLGGISINGNDNNDTTAAVAYKQIDPAGAEDPGAYTINATANWGAMTVAVRPAGFITVSVTGVSGTGQLGTVQLKLGAGIATTGVAGTGAVGTVTVALPKAVTVTGVEASGAVGGVNELAKAVVLTDGVFATGQLGDVTVFENEVVDVSGVEGTAALGDVMVAFPKTVLVTGVSATGAVGSVVVAGKAVVNVVGVYGVTQLGNEEVRNLQYVYPTGVAGTGALGTINVYTGQSVFVSGVSCTAQLSEVAVWTTIDDEQFGVWAPVNDAQTPGWVQIPV